MNGAALSLLGHLHDLEPATGLVHLEASFLEEGAERVPVDCLDALVLPVRELDVLGPLHEARLESLPCRELDCSIHADGLHRHVRVSPEAPPSAPCRWSRRPLFDRWRGGPLSFRPA